MARRRIRDGISPYKPLQVAALASIDRKRLALAVPLSVLADRASIPGRTLRRIRASGRAWDREVRALRMALRQLEKEYAATDALFPEEL